MTETGTLGEADLRDLVPDRVFDGGDLDCGSGLVLLLREHMAAVPKNGVLEMRSREPSVADDLPPWCRLVGHGYLGRLAGEGRSRYFVRRGAGVGAAAEQAALAGDKRRAREYAWRLRVRATGHMTSTVYCRNFSWQLGQPASFEEKDERPCAVEALLGALGSALATAYATDCAREGLEMDDVEIAVRGRLANVLAHLGLEDGDPSFETIEVRCYATTLADGGRARAVWERTVRRSPIAATLAKACRLAVSFSVA